MSSNQRPDTLMQGHVCQIDENLLQRTAGPYIGVKSTERNRGKSMADVRYTSGSPPLRCHMQCSKNGGRNPLLDHLVGSYLQTQWNCTPSALAVLRFIRSSNLVG